MLRGDDAEEDFVRYCGGWNHSIGHTDWRLDDGKVFDEPRGCVDTRLDVYMYDRYVMSLERTIERLTGSDCAFARCDADVLFEFYIHGACVGLMLAQSL